jgi:hypothetical protein
MSRRKLRQEERKPPEDRLLERVQAIAKPPLVESVEEHFAGYFNELGITLRLQAQVEDQEVVALRNDLLRCLEDSAVELAIDFTWQLSMYRGQDQVALVFPGDSAIPTGSPLELIYKVY